MRAVREKAREPLFREWHCIRSRYADRVEAVLVRGFDERAFQVGGIRQKSRLA
jgi:hypothetical protein